MSAYLDSMTLREARALFFERSKLGPTGGYNDRWVKVEAKPFPFYFPNSAGRVAAARLHDLHHIAADYETDWPGEIEIAGWEIASGCARYSAAWVLDIGAFAVGLVVAPRRLYRAFVRGRHAPTNLYRSGFDESELDTTTVRELRDQLGSGKPQPRANRGDIVSFLVWSAAATATWIVPAAIAAALVSLGKSRLRQRHTRAPHSSDRQCRRAQRDAR